jgi:hypothetical protein
MADTPQVTVNALIRHLGPAVHAAIRTAGHSREAHTAWQAIANMDKAEWDAIVETTADTLGQVFLLPSGDNDGMIPE